MVKEGWREGERCTVMVQLAPKIKSKRHSLCLRVIISVRVCVCLERVLVLVWLLAFVCVWVALALPPFMFLFCFSRLPPSGAT